MKNKNQIVPSKMILSWKQQCETLHAVMQTINSLTISVDQMEKISLIKEGIIAVNNSIAAKEEPKEKKEDKI